MIADECRRIARWFVKNHTEWIENTKLRSWAGKLDIKLTKNGVFDDNGLFQLFVLAILWNNGNTSNAETGARVFTRIKSEYTLENFRLAAEDETIADKLRSLDPEMDKARQIFNTLSFLAKGETESKEVWVKVKQILNMPQAGVKEVDLDRFMRLYGVFNPAKQEHAWLKVKLFLIFREIRIQFRGTGLYQYDPVICCVPDGHVRNALQELKLTEDLGTSIYDYVKASEIVSSHFCTSEYELYDLPLFFWDKKGRPKLTN